MATSPPRSHLCDPVHPSWPAAHGRCTVPAQRSGPDPSSTMTRSRFLVGAAAAVVSFTLGIYAAAAPVSHFTVSAGSGTRAAWTGGSRCVD